MKPLLKSNYDLLIIGGGIAGATAAIYSAQSNLSSLILMGPTPGGLLTLTNRVDNYPGFYSYNGYDLMEKIIDHMKLYEENTILYEKATNSNLLPETKEVYIDNQIIKSKGVIIATGSYPRQLNIESEKEFSNKGIHYCGICDGYLYKGKDIAIIGGGNSAFEEAIYLSSIVNHIYLIHRREEFKAFPTNVNKVRKLVEEKKITLILNSQVKEFVGEELLSGIIVNKDSKEEFLSVKGAFIAIGYQPNTDFLSSADKNHLLDENNYIKTNGSCETPIKGVFAAGDVIGGERYKQATIAAAEGTISALKAYSFIRNL